MSFRLCSNAQFLIIACLCSSWAATHDELPQCGITGVYKTRQSVIESPNYPDNYSPNTCWDYVIRSPYRCPTKFHIQFLDFHLESSVNCTNDYLAIGLENDDDDMDLLCGQVIGIKRYHTPDGVLRLRFFADDSPWTTAKGFKLLITRLACERESLLRDSLEPTDEDTEAINAPTAQLSPPQQGFSGIFRNLTFQDQHVPYPLQPLFGLNYPSQLPAPPPPPPNGGLFGFYYPSITQRPAQLPLPLQPPASSRPQAEESKPCLPAQAGITHLPQLYLRSNQGSHTQQAQPLTIDQYATVQAPQALANNAQTRQQIAPPFLTAATEPCCASSFNQKRFYLSSPGFPRTAFTSLLPTQQRDCQFQLEKSAQNICRLRIEFKFFDFGQTYSGTGSKQGNIEVAIGTSRDVCTEDFLEIDGERFCGCRTGYVYNAFWGLGKKLLRMRIGYSGIPSSGFLLDIFQEECNAAQLGATANQNGPNYLQPGSFAGSTPIQQANGFNTFGQQQPQQQSSLSPLGFNNLQQALVSPQAPVGLLPQQQVYPFYQQALPQPQYPQQFWMSPQPQQQLPMSYPMPQFRAARNLEFARSESAQQPLSVVETNSTRKEYYYFDGDEAFARARLADEPDDADKFVSTQLVASARGRCSFDAMNVLRLSMDYYWLTKPTCYSPQGRWFSNLFG